MNIALLLTGFPRYFDRTYPELYNNIISKYNTDIYISTWDKVNLRKNTIDNSNDLPIGHRNEKYINTDINNLISFYNKNLKKISITNFNKYLDNKNTLLLTNNYSNDIFKNNDRAKTHGSFWVERLRDQWYIVKNGYNIIDNPESYDIIIRSRFDIEIKNFDLVIENNKLNIPIDNTSYCDKFAYGKPAIMKLYCSIYDHIPTLYYKYNIDISYAELMLKYYIETICHTETFTQDIISITNY